MKMVTRITKLLEIDYPIISAAMAWVTDARMVAAISNAGGLGTLGPNAGVSSVTKDVAETGERLRNEIRKTRSLTVHPFAVNFVIGAAGLDKAYSERCVKIGIEEQVPVAVVSQGSPEIYTERLKRAGIKVIHVCSTLQHAKKAELSGVDAIIASGTEGGGHSGFEQNTTFCLVPVIAGSVKVPIIAGGGVTTGRQLLAALALGAEGVYIGTRFIATKECPAHENYKHLILSTKCGETIAIRHGYGAKDNQNAEKGNHGFTVERKGSLRIILTDKIRHLLNQYSGLINYDILMKAYTDSPKNEWESLTATTYLKGETDKRFLAAGQGASLISGDVLSCKAVIQEIVKEANLAFGKLSHRHFYES